MKALRPTTPRLVLALLVGAALALPATAAAANPGVTRLQASCAGDTISGKARVRTTTPMKFRLALHSKRSATATFRATGLTRTLRAPRSGSYTFRFNISKLNAYGYRVSAGKKMNSRTMLAASCGPGHQVPEAPLGLLLPLSVLLAVGLPLFLLRRRTVAPKL